MIINIRGTNGSGKTHLARQLIGANAQPVDLVEYPAPSSKQPDRVKWVDGWGSAGGVLAIGSYKQGCGGMDTIPSFAIQQQAVLAAARWDDPRFNNTAKPENIVCEGVLASTVAGSWLDFFNNFPAGGHLVVIAYLDTPLEICLERITARQIAAKGEAREIKVDLVKDKIKAINATRAKFEASGITTLTLRHADPYADLMEFING